MHARLRPAFLATVAAAASASLSVAACATQQCSEKIVAGSSCGILDGKQCKLHDGCGLNGYTCENGHWKEEMTYCNPPPLPQHPDPVPTASPITTTPVASGSAAGPRPGSPAAPCADSVTANASCSPAGAACGVREGCGSNGFHCEGGVWKESFMYCNPPPPPGH